ncbi:hypothetical protein NQZ68_014878 [Dissostichus eleginoides]|nr:hypothetical protein NQZ68_014878 [Dissostichus eleginoides]
MPPAKRCPGFSVQDVIAAIQKGESEFEMESEDSDTAISEEEADEDACGQVDRENQQPNDRPVSDYVDIEPQPNKHTKHRDSGRRRGSRGARRGQISWSCPAGSLKSRAPTPESSLNFPPHSSDVGLKPANNCSLQSLHDRR